MNYNIPVLLLLFNRSDKLPALISALRTVKPKHIFIACDGPRKSVYGEKESVLEVQRTVFKLINWPCEVKTLFREENLGCKLAVSDSLHWFFSQVKEGVVLEDDCIPSSAFFEYVEDMLNTYRDDKRVATISGRREVYSSSAKELTFSSKFFCWGWASWSDRICDIDVEFGYKRKLPHSIFLNLCFEENQHVKGIHNLMLTRMVNSWAYSYDLYFRSCGQLHLVPPSNYITNVGIGGGTHDTKIKNDSLIASDSYKLISRLDNVCKDNAYMKSYFNQMYSPMKILLFPYIGNIKRILKKFGL